MIQYLGRIDIPQSLIDDVKSRAPDHISYQLNSQSHKHNLENLDPSVYNINGFEFYNNDSTKTLEYSKSWYCDVIKEDFLKKCKLNKPKNAIVLRVDPGSFTRPHVDTFKNSLLKKHKDLQFDDIVRLWIPLEDSTFGQAFFVGNSVLYKYKAGDVYTFDNYAFHSAANAGLESRYTLLMYTTKIKQIKRNVQ